MKKYSIDISPDAADSIVRDVIRSSIETLFEVATADDLTDAAFLIEAHNYYSYPDQHLSLEDFEVDR
jgi:hypothetical protein